MRVTETGRGPTATTTVASAARRLHDARLSRQPVAPLTDVDPDLDTATAYAIQEAGVHLRIAAGERIIGGKLGFTSRAMQQAMGVDAPNRGWLTDAMVVEGAVVHLDELLHPKAEPEIALVLGRDLHGEVTAAEVLSATRAVRPCLEVVDSRYRNFRFRAADNIADGSSAARVVLGGEVALPDRPLAELHCELHVDGAVVATSTGAAALDDPAAAAAWMACHVADHPRGLRTGDVVLTGGLTGPVTLLPDQHVAVVIEAIGSVSFEVNR